MTTKNADGIAVVVGGLVLSGRDEKTGEPLLPKDKLGMTANRILDWIETCFGVIKKKIKVTVRYGSEWISFWLKAPDREAQIRSLAARISHLFLPIMRSKEAVA